MRTPKFLPGITFLRDPPRSFSFRRKCSFVGKKGNKKSGKSDLGAFERRGKKLPHRRFLYYILTLSRDSIFGRNSPPRLHNSSGQKSGGNFFCLPPAHYSALLERYLCKSLKCSWSLNTFPSNVLSLAAVFFILFPASYTQVCLHFCRGKKKKNAFTSSKEKSLLLLASP